MNLILIKRGCVLYNMNLPLILYIEQYFNFNKQLVQKIYSLVLIPNLRIIIEQFLKDTIMRNVKYWETYLFIYQFEVINVVKVNNIL